MSDFFWFLPWIVTEYCVCGVLIWIALAVKAPPHADPLRMAWAALMWPCLLRHIKRRATP